jgi:hypothetical protein
MPLAAISHGGGLDAQGCHTSTKTGEYHCHRGANYAPVAPRRAGGPSPAIPLQQAPPRASDARSSGNGRTCYVGPRGGTYTIKPSGRKNYKGC